MVYPSVDSPLLVTFLEGERAEMVAKALEREWDARQREREPILMERLMTWPVDQWAGGVFCERPDLVATLTPDQRERWNTWRAKRNQPATSEKPKLRLIHPTGREKRPE
jgi:hypothetical protein